MNEKGSKRREWVKTAAIVFLSVLLVLTFFSNTIMNYSLPEVATQYVEPGTITAKIRGSGMVESNDPYSVKIKTVQKVDSVEVQKGDTVQEGDVLCYLSTEESEPLDEAKSNLEKALLEYEKQILQGTVSSTQVLSNAQNGQIASLATYQNQILAKEAEIQQYKDLVREAEDKVADLTASLNNTPDASDEKKKLDEAQAAYDAVASVVDAANEAIAGWQEEIDKNNVVIRDYEDGKVETVSDGDIVPVVSAEEYQTALINNGILTDRINNKKQEIAPQTAALPGLKKALDDAQSAYDNKDTDNKNDINTEIRKWEREKADRAKRQEELEKEKATLIADIVATLEWNNNLAELNEKVDKLQEAVTGGPVTSPISGNIMEVKVQSGKDTPEDGVLFTIQPEGKGYTMQFTVTNEQAKRLSVGDTADLVNSWRYDDVTVTLASIKPAPQKPGQQKLLTFDVSGDVAVGQSLNVSVGQKSANYDLIVPNSAIREDNNGKFVLIVETKSSPLNNRYVATRVDVEVLASDDTKSAISGALYGYEYVITTSTAPVEAGKLIRLADN